MHAHWLRTTVKTAAATAVAVTTARTERISYRCDIKLNHNSNLHAYTIETQIEREQFEGNEAKIKKRRIICIHKTANMLCVFYREHRQTQNQNR